MLLRSAEITGLNNSRSPTIKLQFQDDLNIVTGRNGSGKTTLLKLLWYVISGNIEHAVREIPFEKVTVDTSEYRIQIVRRGSDVEHIEFASGDGLRRIVEGEMDEDFDVIDATEVADTLVAPKGSSVFFPTFRRIEGGFSVQTDKRSAVRSARATSALEDAMLDLSRKMSVLKHTFVSSISTVDIVQLLMRQYTEMSERSNRLQQLTSSDIIERIRRYKQGGAYNSDEDADRVIDVIRTLIEELDKRRAEILSPLDAVKDLVVKLFQHSGILLSSRLSFGDAATAVNSEALSAGEKQMLSFICYNAFYDNSIIFIDEPELSLHVDWQRQLLPILQDQGTKNQFIIATHSPFIYSKYPDKELALSHDRGE